MKNLILFLIIILIGCNEQQINPTQPIEAKKVTVVLELTRDYNTEVFCGGQLVSILMENGEIDTITVTDNSNLKAQIHYPNNIGYKYEIAVDSLYWRLP